MNAMNVLPCPACSGDGFASFQDRHARTAKDVCTTCSGNGYIPARTGESAEASFSTRRHTQALAPAAQSRDSVGFRPGEPVEKIGGDYSFEGTIQAVFKKRSGEVRYVVEDDRGVLHIYSEKNLRRTGGSSPGGAS